MAVKTLQEVLAALSGPEKALFEKTLKDNPELEGGWLRQDDYSRSMNEIKAKQAQFDEEHDYNVKMKVWADETVPRWDALVEKGYIDPDTGEEVVTAKMAELNAQVEEARRQALAGGDMKPEELERRVQEIVKANGGLTKEELAAVVREEASKLAKEQVDNRFKEEETRFNENTIPLVAGFSAGVAVVATKYEKETGEAWTPDKQKELFTEMSKEKNYDPFVVGQKMIDSVKTVKQSTAQDEEVKRLREENERLKAGRASEGLPGGGSEPYIPQGVSGAPKGNISRLMEKQGESPDFESMIMSKAAQSAAELRTEGKV